jgi:hypothetical protein
MADAGWSSVVGTAFPGGTYRIDPDQNRAVCRLLGAGEPDGDAAHPAYAYIATRVGCGLGVEEILALVGATKEDGPMVGSLELDFEQPLLVGGTYTVSGEVTSVERKSGRRIGTFDLLGFELRLVDSAGDVAVVCTQSWVLPRRVDAPA